MPKYPPYNQPFAEQLAFFRQKLNLPTARWDDIKLAERDRAFTVAGAQCADLLEDLRGAMDEAHELGTGLDAFRKNFKRIVAERGWTGWTGEGSKGGVAWRTKVIYQTNMATSYAAGRFQQLSDPDLLKVLPYWQYHHNDSVVHPRPLHVAWDGLTLPPDHPFWETHFPPNGWGCQCWVSAVSKEDFMVAIASGKGPANAPTGTAGIDEGFAYAPGASLMPADDEALKQSLLKKLLALPLPLAQQLAQDVAPLLQYTLDNIVQLVAADALAVDAAKKLARLLPGFTQDMLGKIDAAKLADNTPSFGERVIKIIKKVLDVGRNSPIIHTSNTALPSRLLVTGSQTQTGEEIEMSEQSKQFEKQILTNVLAVLTEQPANFGDPDQPRVPAGSPGGGEWTSGGNAPPALSIEDKKTRIKLMVLKKLEEKFGVGKVKIYPNGSIFANGMLQGELKNFAHEFDLSAEEKNMQQMMSTGYGKYD